MWCERGLEGLNAVSTVKYVTKQHSAVQSKTNNTAPTMHEFVPSARRDVQPSIRVQMDLRHDGRHLPELDGRGVRGGVEDICEFDGVQAAGGEGGVGEARRVGCGDE